MTEELLLPILSLIISIIVLVYAMYSHRLARQQKKNSYKDSFKYDKSGNPIMQRKEYETKDV